MRYVERGSDGNIVGHFAVLQPGFAEEEVDDDSPEIVEFNEKTQRARQPQ